MKTANPVRSPSLLRLLVTKTEKKAVRRSELATRRWKRAEIDQKISTLRQKASGAANRSQRLKYAAEIAKLQAQKAAMPLRGR